MKRKILVGLIFISIMGTGTAAYAEPIQTTISAEDQQKLDVQKADLDNATKNVEDTEEQVMQLDNDISTLNDEINKNNQDIQKTQEELSQKQNDYEKAMDIMSDRLREVYKDGTVNQDLTIIFQSKGLDDFINKCNSIYEIMKIDRDTTNKIEEAKKEVEDKESQLEDLKKSNDEKMRELNSKKDELNTKLADLKAKQSQSQQSLSNTESSLMQYPISIINNSTSTDEIQQAITLLRNMRPKMVSSSSDSQIVQAIEQGKSKMNLLSVNKSISLNRGGSLSPSASSNSIVMYAYNFLGTPYVWGGTTPSGFDCSGFTSYVYAKFGINIGRTTYDQIDVGTPVSTSDLKAGDLVFFGNPSAPHHVGIYIGNGQYIHAPHTGDVVKISSNIGDISAVRRIQ